MMVLYILVKCWKDSTNLGMIKLASGTHISRFYGLRENKPFKGRNCVVLIFKFPNLNTRSFNKKQMN